MASRRHRDEMVSQRGKIRALNISLTNTRKHCAFLLHNHGRFVKLHGL